MSNPYAEAIAAAAQAAPMGSGLVPIILGRTLLVDGDGLAYYCAGKDDTEPGIARQHLIDKVQNARRQCGAEHALILLTGSGSIKGHRYAIATVKPYQGQRANSRRPANWGYLREVMETGGIPFPIQLTRTAEADDLFGYYGRREPRQYVHYTQDKDMRMVPGWHLDWVSHRMVWLEPGESLVFNDKDYGPKWFWLQMLHGDAADYIPGLPKYLDPTDKLKPVGEVTAQRLLAQCSTDAECRAAVELAYRGYYKDDWLLHMGEQAILLWMRTNPDDWDDVFNGGNPMSCYNDGEAVFASAYLKLKDRVTYADTINAAHCNGVDEVEGSAAIV